MARKARRITPRETYWNKCERWPDEYAQQIIEGKITLAEVPEHFHALVNAFLEIAKHADERRAVKYGAQIAMMKTLRERRAALSQVPPHLKVRAEYYARQIFEQLRKKAIV